VKNKFSPVFSVSENTGENAVQKHSFCYQEAGGQYPAKKYYPGPKAGKQKTILPTVPKVYHIYNDNNCKEHRAEVNALIFFLRGAVHV